jgi:decaprenylphospho-beta-D-ribofuranose 2-oxidase
VSLVSTRRLLTGWGRTAPSVADVVRPTDPEEVVALVKNAVSSGTGFVARGLGRSYGDAAQSAGGLVVDTTALDHVSAADLESGVVRVGAGVSLDSLMRSLVPRGWWVPVSPGTRYVTVGGAIASDIHGKNHHRDGSFCSHVESLTLVTPAGTVEVTPESDPELFWATAGGMGLTGVIVEATFRLARIETSYMLVDIEKADDLDDCLDRMTGRDSEYRYSVAWIDCLARGRNLGRSVLTRANHATRTELAAVRGPKAWGPGRNGSERRDSDLLAFDAKVRFDVPITPPGGLLNPWTVAAFNEAWYRKAPRFAEGHVETIASYFHPLDAVGSWNRLYGPNGFVQYQFVVPFDSEDVLRSVLERLSSERIASFLAVLKSFGDADPGPLSFPKPGWTLALDLPARSRGLGRILDDLDDAVAQADGRVYLAKDSRLRPQLLGAMYPGLGDWLAVRERVDPKGVLSSDMARRLAVATGVSSHRHARRGRRAAPVAKGGPSSGKGARTVAKTGTKTVTKTVPKTVTKTTKRAAP